MPDRTVLLDAKAIHRVLTRIAHEIAERNEASNSVAIVGVQRGGIHLAERLGALLKGIWGHPVPVGHVDVSMHRDDLDSKAAPNIQPTLLPFDLEGRTVVVVDDVLFSGRTTRAALDTLNDFGRPRRVQLAVLVDRGHRELPIHADYAGRTLTTTRDEVVQVLLREEDGDDRVVLLERTLPRERKPRPRSPAKTTRPAPAGPRRRRR